MVNRRRGAGRAPDDPRAARRGLASARVSDQTPHPDLVELHTDGACSGNPGPGGWAYILKHPASGMEREDSGSDTDTTNNRMELRAVIEGLSVLNRPSKVELYSDSQYVLNGLNKWLAGWKQRGWKTANKQPVKNAELWRQLDELMRTHDLTFHWIRGHDGHAENERCDALAVAARDRASAARQGR